MQIYTVHTKSRSPSFVLKREEMEKTVFVKEGFCWTAMLFTVLWAGWHHMWRHGAILIVAALLLGLISDGMDVAAPLQTLVALGMLLIIGFEGNNWRRTDDVQLLGLLDVRRHKGLRCQCMFAIFGRC